MGIVSETVTTRTPVWMPKTSGGAAATDARRCGNPRMTTSWLRMHRATVTPGTLEWMPVAHGLATPWAQGSPDLVPSPSPPVTPTTPMECPDSVVDQSCNCDESDGHAARAAVCRPFSSPGAGLRPRIRLPPPPKLCRQRLPCHARLRLSPSTETLGFPAVVVTSMDSSASTESMAFRGRPTYGP